MPISLYFSDYDTVLICVAQQHLCGNVHISNNPTSCDVRAVTFVSFVIVRGVSINHHQSLVRMNVGKGYNFVNKLSVDTNLNASVVGCTCIIVIVEQPEYYHLSEK